MRRRWSQKLKEMSQLVVLDVGARGGIHPRWSHVSRHITAILFDADAAACVELQHVAGSSTLVINTALFESSAEIEFHLCKNPGVSSIYRPNYNLLEQYPNADRFEVVDTVEVQATSLDELWATRSFPKPHFIKIDTQGSELPILRGGADSVLKGMVGVEVEIEYVPIYQGQPLFHEVDALMRSMGFLLYDLKNYYWQQERARVQHDASLGDLIFADALYFRAPEAIACLTTSDHPLIAPAIQCYLAYGYTHLAQVLIDMAASDNLIDSSERKTLLGLVRKHRKPAALGVLPRSGGVKRRAINFIDWLFPSISWATISKSDLGS